jgi:hypothetical protein
MVGQFNHSSFFFLFVFFLFFNFKSWKMFLFCTTLQNPGSNAQGII